MATESATAVERRAGSNAAGIAARSVWVQIHLWLGLTLGVIGALIAVTGSVLVYDQAIDAWLNPLRYRTTGDRVALPYAVYAQGAEAAVGDGSRTINLRLPDGDATPVVAFMRMRGEGGGIRRVYLDPPTARVLDAPTGRGAVGWAHDIHGSLLLRDYNGRTVVGVAGIAMLISSLSGIYLWWPRRRFSKLDFAFRPAFPLSRNLHYTFGFYGSLVLAALSFTGIVISFPDAARGGVAAFGPLSESARNVQTAKPRDTQAIDIERAAAIARSLYPQSTPTSIGLPAGPRGVYRIGLREFGDADPRPVTQVFVDPSSGAVLRRVDRASQTRGDAFLAFQRPLHEGEALGAIGRAIVFAAGLAPPVLAVTGTMMWLRARTRRRRAVASARA